MYVRFLHTLTFRVLAGSCILLFTLFGLYSYFAIGFHTQQMIEQMFDSANRVSDVIRHSTRYSMLLNRREDVYQIITTIGREPGVEGIRIYNKRGMIMFSTNKAEESRVVDMRAEACFACHDSAQPLRSLPMSIRTRVYAVTGGRRIVGLINPIRNEPACSNSDCHAHPADRTVLGVLDVRMSLDKMDANILEAERKLILYGVSVTLVVALGSGLFLYMMVHRPVQKLREGTKQIAAGNLDYSIISGSSDEIGELARAFNDMTRSLRSAEEQNRTWSETLEKRVQDKSDELKQIHEGILQIEKMTSLGKLAATVAHELNNPLEGILTYAKLIAKRMRKAEGGAANGSLEDIDLIVREVQRCGNIVKNLLLFSKKQVEEFGLVSVLDIVEKAAQLMRHHFKISNVNYMVNCTTPNTTLMCDENQIQQALVALFVNAVEAMPGGGDLTLTINRTTVDDLQICLRDSGVGIPAQDLKRIFEPFFTTKSAGKGVGLGLSVVYGIVERHGGTVSVNSEVGAGTTFVLTFPPPGRTNPRVEGKDAVFPSPAV
jgi:two-component system NtrC family sensor kinase